MSERFVPWFGTWPPELYGGNEEMASDAPSLWERAIRLSWAAILGLLLIGFSFWPDLKEAAQIIQATLGTTLFVIFGLGITVDWWLKKAILDDVVKASLGYVLPESLKPAMRWIYGQRIVCIRHNQTIEIMDNPANSKTVIVKSMLHRSLKNLSNAPSNINVGLAIDEWFEDGGESEIIEMGYRIGDKSTDLSSNKNRFGYGWKIDKQPIELLPNTIIDTWSTFREIRGLNDVSSWVFSYATQEPIVTIKLSTKTQLNYEVGFTYADDVGTKVVSLGLDTWKLPTTLLPMQAIKIRWWEKSKSEKWLNG